MGAGRVPTIKGGTHGLETLPILLTVGAQEEPRNGELKSVCFEILIRRACGNVQGRWKVPLKQRNCSLASNVSAPAPQDLCDAVTTPIAVNLQTQEHSRGRRKERHKQVLAVFCTA